MLLRSFRKTVRPCSICRPPEASGPVLMVRKPTLIGPPCATAAGIFSADAATPVASAPFRTVRRLRLMLFPSVRVSCRPMLVQLRDGSNTLLARHDGQQHISLPGSTEMQRGLPTEDRRRAILRIVMQERPATRQFVLEVRQPPARAAAVFVILAAHRERDATARRHHDRGRPHLDAERARRA